jgi:molybdopterin/thiamine biosynthesis adenylyltransferase
VVASEHEELKPSNARSLLKGYDLVVDLFDNAPSRKLIQEQCLELDIPCLHAGMATVGYFAIVWNEDYTAPVTREREDDNAPCDYPMAANLVMLCVASTAEIINRYIDSKEKKNIEFWLKSMSFKSI